MDDDPWLSTLPSPPVPSPQRPEDHAAALGVAAQLEDPDDSPDPEEPHGVEVEAVGLEALAQEEGQDDG